VVRALQRFPEIEELNSVSGPVDYMAVIRCDTHARLDKLLDEIGMLDGVNHTRRRSCWRGRSTGDGPLARRQPLPSAHRAAALSSTYSGETNMNNDIRVAVGGVTGWAGGELARGVAHAADMTLVAACRAARRDRHWRN
jgi:hypothetical protein